MAIEKTENAPGLGMPPVGRFAVPDRGARVVRLDALSKLVDPSEHEKPARIFFACKSVKFSHRRCEVTRFIVRNGFVVTGGAIAGR